jgi:hypothetical protein
MLVDWAFPIAFGVGTVWLLWHGLVVLPHQYDVLGSRGVPVRVQVVRCGAGQGNDSHGYGCQVRTDYEGRVHQWRVDRDVRLQTGADGEANGLVDPLDPERSALAEDVDRRTGTGGSVLVFAAVTGTACVISTAVLLRRRLRRRDRLPTRRMAS